MSQIKADRLDKRSFHGTQSIARTSLGVHREGGISGYGKAVEATYMATLQFTVDLDTGAAQIWDLPPGIYGYQGATIEGGTGAGGLALVEVLNTDGVLVESVLYAALPLDGKSAAWVPFDNAMEVNDAPKFLRITPTVGGASGTATFVLQVGIAATGWK